MEKINIFLFTLSILFIIRELYLFIQSAIKNRRLIDTEIIPYNIPVLRLVGLWLSIGFLITSLFKGF